MNQNQHYNKHLRSYAWENRNSMTKAEACLWKYALSKKQMLGFIFRRQRPIHRYIADFICLPLKLIIEVDGVTHLFTENQAKDAARQKVLEDLGYTVIRFRDEEVLNSMNQVREAIMTQMRILEEDKA